MLRYLPVQEELQKEELGTYRSYGICVMDDNDKRVAYVPDVSPDPKVVAQIAGLCTVGQLDPEQLKDVIQNTI